MSAALWSWVLTAWGVTGLWIAGSGGRRARWGWCMGIAGQALWATYALVTDQPGFLVSAGVYGAMFIRNWRRAVTSAPTRASSGEAHATTHREDARMNQ